MNKAKIIDLTIKLLFWAVIIFFVAKADSEKNKMIVELKERANLVPVVTVDALGICKVTQGGKTYMLIDVTNETKALDIIEQNIINK